MSAYVVSVVDWVPWKQVFETENCRISLVRVGGRQSSSVKALQLSINQCCRTLWNWCGLHRWPELRQKVCAFVPLYQPLIS